MRSPCPDAFLTGAGAIGLDSPDWARDADPDEGIPGSDVFIRLERTAFPAPSDGVVAGGVVASGIARFAFFDFIAFSPASAGVEVCDEVTSDAFGFFGFDIFSPALAGAVACDGVGVDSGLPWLS